MKKHTFTLGATILAAVFLMACAKPAPREELIKSFALDSLDGVITQNGVTVDKNISNDGKGSLKITVTEPTTIKLFETGPVDAEDAVIYYRAKVRSQDLQGKAYLEMWCQIAGMGEFFSRGLDNPVTGTSDWASEQIPFFLKKGQKPDNLKLNLVIDGKGTVWIDDIKLVKAAKK